MKKTITHIDNASTVTTPKISKFCKKTQMQEFFSSPENREIFSIPESAKISNRSKNVYIILETGEAFYRQSDIAIRLNSNVCYVSECITGKREDINGYHILTLGVPTNSEIALFMTISALNKVICNQRTEIAALKAGATKSRGRAVSATRQKNRADRLEAEIIKLKKQLEEERKKNARIPELEKQVSDLLAKIALFSSVIESIRAAFNSVERN